MALTIPSSSVAVPLSRLSVELGAFAKCLQFQSAPLWQPERVVQDNEEA
jgi:hypothetical protein